jgi:hypothetical protein
MSENTVFNSIWWHSNSRNGKQIEKRSFDLSPTENFIRATYYYNYLLNAQKVNSFEDIDNASFKEYLANIKDDIFDPNVPVMLFKQNLPISYNVQMENIIYKRNIIDTNSDLLSEKAHCSIGVHDPKMDIPQLYPDNNYSNKSWNEIYTLDSIGFKKTFTKLIDQNALIPCFDVTKAGWISSKSVLSNDIASYEGHDHKKYSEFMTSQNPEFDIEKHIGSKLGIQKLPLTADSKLYWIDIQSLAFKHTRILNEGNVNKKSGVVYDVIKNVEKVKDDPHFYTELMQNAAFGIDEGQKVCTPITVFIVDNHLYSHDHKRIVANLIAGNRYLLGTINQDHSMIVSREIGYRPMKGVFSTDDKSIIVNLTDDQIQTFGHYFFVVGSTMKEIKTKFTPFMNTVVTTDVESRLNYVSKSGSRLLEYEFSQFPTGHFKHYHKCCYPTLFQSLDKTDALVNWYMSKLTDACDCLIAIKADIEMQKTQDMFINNKASKVSKPVKKKVKNKASSQQGHKQRKLLETSTLPDITDEHSISLIAKVYAEDDLEIFFKTVTDADFNIVCAKLKILSCDPANKIEYCKYKNILMKNFSSEQKKKIQAFFGSTKKQKAKKVQPKRQSTVNNPNKKQLSEYITCSRRSITYLFLVPYHKELKEAEFAAFLTNVESIIDGYIVYMKKQLVYVNDNNRTIEELLTWELNNIGNSFWYLLKNKNIHYSIKNLILIKYPFINKPTSMVYGLKKGKFFDAPREFIRYSKTGIGVLEDLVFILRHGSNYGLNDRQTHSIQELVEWQQQNTESFKVPHIMKDHLCVNYPESTNDGLITDKFMDMIMSLQKPDHQRILKKEITDDTGVYYVYGAYQGLIEEVKYTELHECSLDMKYSIHLTHPDTFKLIMSHETVEIKRRDKVYRPKPGHLDLLGRYIHAFGWAEPNADNFSLIGKIWDDVKERLFNRFRGRIGIAIDMLKLYNHYKDICKWSEVCGINEINTVIFLKPVPPQALIVKNRQIDDSGQIVNIGEPFQMEEMWRMHYDRIW